MDVAWRTNEQLAQLAHRLGTAITTMLDHEGPGVPDFPPLTPGGAPSDNPQRTLVDSIVADAVDFMSLEPQKVADEYQRMQQAADDTGENGEAKGNLKIALTQIAANWHGDAAVAFARQVSNIEEFMNQQERNLLVAAQAMGTAFSLAVRIRESYCDLAETTIAACRNVIDEQNQGESPKAGLAMGLEIVKSGVDLADLDSVKKFKGWAIDKFFDALTDAVEEQPVDDSGAGQVVDSYLRSRDQLRRSYEAGLEQLRDWLNNQHWAYLRKPIPLLAPLPSCAHVESPDFSYEKFLNDHHSPGTYGSKVEQERKKLVEAQPPSGAIAERLADER